jgi:hypothetical protein
MDMGQAIMTVKVDYQHCEEILSTTGLYEVDGGINAIAVGTLICEEAALHFGSLIAGSLAGIIGPNDRIISVDTHIPVDPDQPWGPWHYHRGYNTKGTDQLRTSKLTDMIAAQIVWVGQNELDEPVRNARYWSMLTASDVDCMELVDLAQTEIQTAFNTFWPLAVNLSSGTIRRVVKNLRAGVVTTYHPCTSVQVSKTVATMIQRRGDVTPKRGKIVPDDPGPVEA